MAEDRTAAARDRPGVTGRQFTILDAMILVAATAVAIAWTRVTAAVIWDYYPFSAPVWPQPALFYLIWWPAVAVPALMSGSLSIFGLGLRRSRFALRPLLARPGPAVCGIAVVALIIQAALIAIGVGLSRVPGMTFGRAGGAYSAWLSIARGLTDVGLAVIAVWLALASNPRREGPSDWIDRSGMAIGAGWIVLFLIQRVVPYIMGA